MSLDWSGIPQVQPADALRIVEGGKGVVVDVREPEELRQVSLKTPKVINVPTTKLSQATSAAALPGLGFPDDLGRSEGNPAFVMCKAGVRGQRMCEVLKGLGCTHVANLTGGIMNCSETK
eukprot:TRINITY_DN2245_c0_g2_i1.p1 TRINITY_DN2245_c0_g2~~TRINITY_DN2245_c0_g2_i1.p1  ORF type:complete len:120 (+),score=57.03 TRINITY_DN2245_c0_g2_i1:67-426(+)